MCAQSEEEFLKTFVSRSNYKGDGANVLRATWREDEVGSGDVTTPLAALHHVRIVGRYCTHTITAPYFERWLL